MIKLNFPLYLIKLVKSFLRDRFFYIDMNGTVSNSKPLNCGVPQGAVLSPFLYNIYFADIKNVIAHNTNFAQFADDTAIYASGNELNFILSNIQSSINNIVNHYDKWGITL